MTLYDLIPELFAEHYLADPSVRAWYRARLGLVRHADRVLAISHTTARDAIEHLGLRPERVVVAGAAPAPRSRRRSRARRLSRKYAADYLASSPASCSTPVESSSGRTSTDCWRPMPVCRKQTRREHQLVIVCRVLPVERRVLEAGLRALGILDRVYFTGFVEDEDLRLLYGCAELFVFPSLYEGYGLPVAEAIVSGAPAIASNGSSLVELVEDEAARFDPFEVESIRTTIARALERAGVARTLARDPAAQRRHVEGRRHADRRGLP